MWLKFALALIPIIWLIVSLGVIKIPAPQACLIGLLMTILLAIYAFKLPLIDAITGSGEGILMGLWPILYVIVAALFIYNVANKSGGLKVIQDVLSSITTDKRILVLIIAWGFGGFMEAIAGFGTAVAIPAGILIAFGIDPIKASVICLIANTTPTAFGAVGLPMITLSNVTGLSIKPLSFVVTLQLVVLVVIIPFVLVSLMGGGLKALKGVLFMTLMSGLSFALPQVLVAKYIGAELPAVVGSIICILVTVLLARRQSKNVQAKRSSIPAHSAAQVWRVSSPFILVFAFVVLASSLFPPINHALSLVKTSFTVYSGKGASPFVINWLSSPGTLILLASLFGGWIQGLSFKEMMQILGKTIKGMGKTAVTVCSIVALAKVMSYSGMTQSIATALIKCMGPVYPLIAPLIGAIGTFITGSDTSANVLFGNLQLSAAESLGADSYWIVANNMIGATAGKMISPQSIAVASAAIGQKGSEGEILKQSLKWCCLYLIIICIFLYVVGLSTGKF